jgi:hypothetical protein
VGWRSLLVLDERQRHPGIFLNAIYPLYHLSFTGLLRRLAPPRNDEDSRDMRQVEKKLKQSSALSSKHSS